ncbi:MRG/MORF4L-binding protein [Tetranychus urticae]|uniref:Chromatin modification-related protein EAF7 n=1 Tax=Tetranychus urticae TaxID=32264 RepID=T1KFP5_TETUR|nr:MRG/MORF4L-binding protein [Tetranychus urticae]
MKPNKDGLSSQNKKEEIQPWKPEKEVQLFYALGGRRPVGINRFFQMIFVQEEFNRLTGQEVTSEVIWKYLDTIYDMDVLNENEDLPFSNKQSDFVLPHDYQIPSIPLSLPATPATPTKSPNKSTKS